VAVAVAVVLEAGLEGRQLLRAKLEEAVAQVLLVMVGQVQPEHFTALVEVDITELAATTVALEAEEDTVGMAPLAEAVVEAHLTVLGQMAADHMGQQRLARLVAASQCLCPIWTSLECL
jgi:hypothetical protein